MLENDVERASIGANDPIEEALRDEVEASALRDRPVAQQLGAEHRHERERHDRRDHDGDGEGDGEFVEQPSDHVVHEQERNQHGDRARR